MSKKKEAPIALDLGQAARILPSLWAYKNRKLKGLRCVYSHGRDVFRHRPFLQLLLDDPHPSKVFMKARQLGATEVGVNEVLFVSCTFPSVTTIYTMRTLPHAQEFSSLRMDEAIMSSPGIRAFLSGASSSTKTFFPMEGQQRSVILVKGSWDEALGEGTAADILILDEYDRMKDGVEDAFKESLSSSRLGWIRYYSTPTIPGRAISKRFEESDKRRWHLKCIACNEWQHLTWSDNIKQVKGPPDLADRLRFDPGLELEPGSFEKQCRKCGKVLNLMELQGEWVAEKPSRSATDSHGYHVSQIAAAWIPADAIALKMREHRLIQHWHNYVLGEPYLGEGLLCTESDIDRAVNPTVKAAPGHRIDGWLRVAVGVDWGDTNWALVMAVPEHTRKPCIVDFARIPAKGKGIQCCDDVLRFSDPYLADTIIADFGYGQDRNPYMVQKLGARFWSCLYPGGNRATMKAEWNPYRQEVFIGRTPGLKSLYERLQSGQLQIAPLPDDKMRTLKKHLTALVPWKETRPIDGEIFEEVVRTGDDHLAHGALYALLGIERSTMSMAKLTFVDLPTGPNILGTPQTVVGPPRGEEVETVPSAEGGWKMTVL